MAQPPARCCRVCGAVDARALIDVKLVGGTLATLCGSHALMHRRCSTQARSEAELRSALRERRGRRERRDEGDALGAKLAEAFAGERREGHRRRA